MQSDDTQSQTTIVLVEDNDLDAMLVQRLMRRHSLDAPVVRARNGEEALAILEPPGKPPAIPPPFVIVLDLNMPRMNGFELLDVLSGDDYLSKVPVFILTTSSSHQDCSKAREYNIEDYLVKPVSANELREILAAPDPDSDLQSPS